MLSMKNALVSKLTVQSNIHEVHLISVEIKNEIRCTFPFQLLQLLELVFLMFMTIKTHIFPHYPQWPVARLLLSHSAVIKSGMQHLFVPILVTCQTRDYMPDSWLLLWSVWGRHCVGVVWRSLLLNFVLFKYFWSARLLSLWCSFSPLVWSVHC